MAMARLARAYTGKPNIIKHECGYHGWNDTFEYDYGIAGLKEALSVGVPAYYHTHVQAVPSDDIPAMRAQLEENEKTGGTAAVAGGGSGSIRTQSRTAFGVMSTTTACPDCAGSGRTSC